MAFILTCQTALTSSPRTVSSASSSVPTTPSIAGYDKGTEKDFASSGNFFSNYEPLTRAARRRPWWPTPSASDTSRSHSRSALRAFVKADSPAYVASSDQPRYRRGQTIQESLAISKIGRTSTMTKASTSPKSALRLYRRIPSGKGGARAGECRPAWTPQQPAECGSRASAHSPSTTRSTTKSSPSSSWTLPQVSPASPLRPRAPARRARSRKGLSMRSCRSPI